MTLPLAAVAAREAARQLTKGRGQTVPEQTDLDDDEKGLSQKDAESLVANPPSEPSFPVVIFGFAVFKDLLDIVSLGLLGWLFAFILGAAIWIWLLGKSSSIKKLLIKRTVVPIVLSLFAGAFPFLNFAPEATFLIYFIHRSETGIAKRVFARARNLMRVFELAGIKQGFTP